MNLPKPELAARLQSWAAYLSESIWVRSVAELPMQDALDAILAGPPSWVTRDPIPAGQDARITGTPLDALLLQAWGSGDAELEALADHCESLGAHYLGAQDNPQPPTMGDDAADRIRRLM